MGDFSKLIDWLNSTYFIIGGCNRDKIGSPCNNPFQHLNGN